MGRRERGIIFTGANVRAILSGRKTQTRRTVRFPVWAAGCFDDPLKIKIEADDHGRDPEVICNDTGCLTALPLPWRVGDRLWVRETFVLEDDREYVGTAPLPTDGRPIQHHDHPEWGRWHKIPHYRATEPEPHIVLADREDPDDDRTRWSSPIHMPRWASRLALTVTDVRVERLQDISEADAIAEGATMRPACSGFLLRDAGWSMDWSQVGQPSRFARKDGRLGEADISLGSPVAAFASYINDIHDPKWNHKGDGIFGQNPWVTVITFTPDPRP